MLDRRTAVLLIASIGFSATALAAGAADLKSPDQVKVALRLMLQVTHDIDRQITRKTYARLPHENVEFQEASAALRQAIGEEPKAFQAKVDPALDRAVAAPQKVADESGAGDDGQLRAGHAQLLKGVNAVFAYFPQDLR